MLEDPQTLRPLNVQVVGYDNHSTCCIASPGQTDVTGLGQTVTGAAAVTAAVACQTGRCCLQSVRPGANTLGALDVVHCVLTECLLVLLLVAMSVVTVVGHWPARYG